MVRYLELNLQPMQIFTGTSGFSYKEWKGEFYPSDLKNADMLGYYATRLPAVEINNTFYRLPRESVLESWADAVGPDFRFILEVSRMITHSKRLKDVEQEEWAQKSTTRPGKPSMSCSSMRMTRPGQIWPRSFSAGLPASDRLAIG